VKQQITYNKLQKMAIVFNALSIGVPVEIDKYTYALGEDENGHSHLCYVAMSWSYGKPPVEKLLVADMSVGQFIETCDKLTDHEVYVLAANNGLNKVLKEKHR